MRQGFSFYLHIDPAQVTPTVFSAKESQIRKMSTAANRPADSQEFRLLFQIFVPRQYLFESSVPLIGIMRCAEDVPSRISPACFPAVARPPWRSPRHPPVRSLQPQRVNRVAQSLLIVGWPCPFFSAAPRTRLCVQAMERGTIQLQRADSVKSRRYNWACLIWQKLRCVKAPPLVRFIVTNAAAVRAS